MKKVLFITEYLNPPFDEGIKKTAFHFYLELNKNYNSLTLCRKGFHNNNIEIIKFNSLFLSLKLYKIINKFKPSIIVYLPFSSATFASYVRINILKLLSGYKKTVFIGLQSRTLKKWQQLLIPLLKPSYGLTPSPELKKFWVKKKIKNKLLPLITDLTVFKPLKTNEEKLGLRKKYNIPLASFIILHVGHITKTRNLEALISLQNNECQVVIVGSTSTPNASRDKHDLKRELLEKKILFLDYYIEKIEEVYQFSDVYVFPVVKETGSISLPLSILEARACGLPVITTHFGGLEEIIGNDNRNILYRKPREFEETVKSLRKKPQADFHNTNVSNINVVYTKIIQDIID